MRERPGLRSRCPARSSPSRWTRPTRTSSTWRPRPAASFAVPTAARRGAQSTRVSPALAGSGSPTSWPTPKSRSPPTPSRRRGASSRRDSGSRLRHVIVTRFSVPRLDTATASRHADLRWLDERLALFRTWFVPSVERLGVPALLLCSSQSAGYVGEKVRDLPWVSIVVQDDWYGGWSGAPEQIVTRLDSDDAVREDWFQTLDRAPSDFDVHCTRDFLRLDAR